VLQVHELVWVVMAVQVLTLVPQVEVTLRLVLLVGLVPAVL
jgi:hypothetical protein